MSDSDAVLASFVEGVFTCAKSGREAARVSVRPPGVTDPSHLSEIGYFLGPARARGGGRSGPLRCGLRDGAVLVPDVPRVVLRQGMGPLAGLRRQLPGLVRGVARPLPERPRAEDPGLMGANADTVRCPACARRVRPIAIVYGYPSADTFAAAQLGEVAIGGCVVTGNDPTHRCPECGADLVRAGREFELAIVAAARAAAARNFDELLWELDARDGELDGEFET